MSNPVIEPQDLQQLVQSTPHVLIDTRKPEAYAAGHLPGAVNIPEVFTFLATSTPQGLAELETQFSEKFGQAGLDGEKVAILYEDAMDTGFGQSCRGLFLLEHLGYPKDKIRILHGGFQGWVAAGLTVSSEAPSPIPATFPLDIGASDVMLDKDDVLAALSSDQITLLDVRDVDEWVGESSSPYGKDFCPRKGRLPDAVWIEWYRFMKPGEVARFKSPTEIRAECDTVGITPHSEVYLYCFKGARASNTLVALRSAGIEKVRLYFGSWNEWSRDPSLPIDEGLPYVA
ncbi:MAG: sulfurtransferase [Halothiobacillaceae bacterium]|nr:sulfurtransferase [Halothiobacillaceae bacterium]HER20212.1 sulfurtransferase [Chromatiales bacterium]